MLYATTDTDFLPPFRRGYSLQAAPSLESGAWLDTDLAIRDRIRKAHPDLTDDEIWDMLERS